MFKCVLLLAVLMICPRLWAEEGRLFRATPMAPAPVVAGEGLMSEASARRALAAGFPAVAARMLEELIGKMEPGRARDEAGLALVAAYLDEGRVEQAARALERVEDRRGAGWRLRAGMIAVVRGETGLAREWWEGIERDELPAAERAWYHFLEGMILDTGREGARAEEAYQKAVEQAESELQRARFTLARERARLERGETTPAQAEALRANAERFQGRGVGYEFARQYAVALTQLDRRAEAVAYLQARLGQLPEGERAVREDLRLMLGLVAGADDSAGRGALEAVLAEGGEADKQRVALQVLARRVREGRGELRLAGLIQRTDPPHAILEDLLLVRAELRLAAKAYAEAEADATALVQRFPNSSLRAAALGVLAQVQWELRRFRGAADYAAQARVATSDPEARAALGVLIAEAYFRAGDFTGAAGAYGVALGEVPAGVSPGALMFQWVMAELEAGRWERAAGLLDELSEDARFDALNRWHAEWNLARVLQGKGRNAQAFERIAGLNGGGEAAGMPAGLRVRMIWLEARLALGGGRVPEALVTLERLRASLSLLEGPLRAEIDSQARLVEAEARFAQGENEAAIAGLAELRVAFPGSEAMLRSFIVEADHYAAAGRLVDAQDRLTKLADDAGAKAYAPLALYQAALLAERRGQDEHYRQAYLLLERLVDEHPQSELVFYARLKQGDLLRVLNQFGAAQQIYELLINRFSEHAEVLAAQLGLAACHRAQAVGDGSHFESALTIFERLRDLTSAPVDLRVEAGFQLGDMLVQRGREGDVAGALVAWWLMVDAFLLDERRAEELGPKGRYWMSRLLVRFANVSEVVGQRRSAREAWGLIIELGLPGGSLARTRLGLTEGVELGVGEPGAGG